MSEERVDCQGMEEEEHGQIPFLEPAEVVDHISTLNSLSLPAEMQLRRRSQWMFPALLQAKTTELAQVTTSTG